MGMKSETKKTAEFVWHDWVSWWLVVGTDRIFEVFQAPLFASFLSFFLSPSLFSTSYRAFPGLPPVASSPEFQSHSSARSSLAVYPYLM